MQPGLRDGHLFSLFLMLPLAYVTLALLLFNWYPSQVGVTVPLTLHDEIGEGSEALQSRSGSAGLSACTAAPAEGKRYTQTVTETHRR